MKQVTTNGIEANLNALQTLVKIAFAEALEISQPDDEDGRRVRNVTDLLMFASEELGRLSVDFAAWHEAQCAKAAASAA